MPMRRRKHGGWVVYDVLSAMILMSMLGGILAVAGHREHLFMQQMGDSRAATRAAEAALEAMQAGGSIPANSDQATFSVHQLSQSGNMSWAQISATVGHRTSSLIGLVPSKSIPGGKP